jgi:hypothetical protein
MRRGSNGPVSRFIAPIKACHDFRYQSSAALSGLADPSASLGFKHEYRSYNFLIRSFAKFEISDMTPQHKGEGSVNPISNPASSTSGAGICLKMTPNASVRAASIHENDDSNVPYRVYGSYDLGWEDITERKGLVSTILSMKTSEVEEFLEQQSVPPIKTFTECLSGLLQDPGGNVIVLYE